MKLSSFKKKNPYLLSYTASSLHYSSLFAVELKAFCLSFCAAQSHGTVVTLSCDSCRLLLGYG